MPILEDPELLDQIPADFGGSGLQLVVEGDLERRERGGAGGRAPAKGAEKFHAVVEAGRDRARCDDGPERVAVGDRLTEDDNVRRDVVRFKSPEVRADPPEPGLHLVGDREAAPLPHETIDLGEKPRWQEDLAADARTGFGQVAAEPMPLAVEALEERADLRGIGRTGVGAP